MKRLCILLLLVCGLPMLASAQTVTFDFGKTQTYFYTPEEVSTLARLLAEINKQRATSRPPLPEWGIEDWQMAVIRNTLSSYGTEVKAFYAQDGCENFEKNVDAQTKSDVLTYFGGHSPCAPSRQ